MCVCMCVCVCVCARGQFSAPSAGKLDMHLKCNRHVTDPAPGQIPGLNAVKQGQRAAGDPNLGVLLPGNVFQVSFVTSFALVNA